VAAVAVPSFLLGIGIVIVLALSVLQPEASVISDLFACGAELLAVNYNGKGGSTRRE
jgi:hypothetical protein